MSSIALFSVKLQKFWCVRVMQPHAKSVCNICSIFLKNCFQVMRPNNQRNCASKLCHLKIHLIRVLEWNWYFKFLKKISHDIYDVSCQCLIWTWILFFVTLNYSSIFSRNEYKNKMCEVQKIFILKIKRRILTILQK